MKLFNLHFNQPIEIELAKGNVVRLAPREEKEVDDKFADSPVLERYKKDVKVIVEEKPKAKKATDEK
jgi:hypothetical protein